MICNTIENSRLTDFIDNNLEYIYFVCIYIYVVEINNGILFIF